MSSRSLRIILLIVVALNLFLVAIYFITTNDKKSINSQQIYKMGEATEVGYVGVEVTYDKEPIDVEIISPSGKHYSKFADVYEIDADAKTITVLCDTEELGVWTVSFNTKSNENITYKFINRPSPTLRMTNLELVKLNDYYYLSFTPIMSTDEYTECNFSVTMSSTNRSFPGECGQIPLNEPAFILFNPPETAYDGNLYSIKVALNINLVDANYHTHDVIEVRLQDNSSIVESTSENSASENETETEEVSD